MTEIARADGQSSMSTDSSSTGDGLALVWALWPLLLATFVYTLPIVATSIFIAPMAADHAASTAVVGSMRGIGGASALVVGLLLAPLIDRAPRSLVVSGGLILGVVADLFAVAGLLTWSAVVTVVLAPLVFISPTVPLALASTALFCVASGVMLAALMSLLIRRYAPIRGSVMGLNAVGLNVGLIAGASVAGLGLGLGGYVGLAATLVLMAGAAAAVILVAARSLREPVAPPEVPSPV